MNPNQLADEAARLADQALTLSNHAQTLIIGVSETVAPEVNPFIFLLAIFLCDKMSMEWGSRGQNITATYSLGWVAAE